MEISSFFVVFTPNPRDGQVLTPKITFFHELGHRVKVKVTQGHLCIMDVNTLNDYVRMARI